MIGKGFTIVNPSIGHAHPPILRGTGRTEARSLLFLWLLTAGVVAAYLMLATQYALLTPRWQIPDEPAHYNYVEHIATTGTLPVLMPGDYPNEYLEEIKAARFPSDMSIAPIRYESHQPPLYYVASAAVYRVASPLGPDVPFFALRLFSVLQGCIVVALIVRLGLYVFPQQHCWAAVPAASVVVIPMYLTMSSGINNDTLAQLVLMLVLVQSAKIARQGRTRQGSLTLGLLLGIAAWTKSTIYLPCAAAVLAILIAPPARENESLNSSGRSLAIALGTAAAIAVPLFLNNIRVYGRWDLLGWNRHDAIVEGQLRTATLIADIGWPAFVARFLTTTFRSFWAQFGWMAVPVEQWIYRGWALLTGILAIGLLARYWRLMLKRQLLIAWEALRAWRGSAARARLRGLIAGLVSWPRMWRQRQIIQSSRQVSVEYLDSLLSPVDELTSAG